jgi:uncharacterized membrane protein
MNVKHVTSSTVALLVAALIILAVGTYTDNDGFQLAGVLVLVVGAIRAFTEARNKPGNAQSSGRT